MKRNISLVVLAFEITAIVVLHAIKMTQSPSHQQTHDISANANITKSKIAVSAVKRYSLLSIK